MLFFKLDILYLVHARWKFSQYTTVGRLDACAHMLTEQTLHRIHRNREVEHCDLTHGIPSDCLQYQTQPIR